MLEDNPMLRRRGSAPPAPGVGETPPSTAAQQRLSGALRDRSQAYQQGASVDLTIMEALLRLDHPEAAVKALEDHRASLHAMARDLQVAVADAAVEREAERVCSAVEQLPAPRHLGSTLRRRSLALTGAAAVVIALVLPTARFSPRTTLTNVEGRSTVDDVAAARERLEAARSWARALRETMSTQDSGAAAAAPAQASDGLVRDKVRTILAADEPGGSAAENVSNDAEVIDLAAARARRATAGGTATRHRDPDPQPPADPEPPAGPRPTDVVVPEVKAEIDTKSAPQRTPLNLKASVEADEVSITVEDPSL